MIFFKPSFGVQRKTITFGLNQNTAMQTVKKIKRYPNRHKDEGNISRRISLPVEVRLAARQEKQARKLIHGQSNTIGDIYCHWLEQGIKQAKKEKTWLEIADRGDTMELVFFPENLYREAEKLAGKHNKETKGEGTHMSIINAVAALIILGMEQQ